VKQKIGYVAIVVRDYDEAIAFYTRVMGFDLIEDTNLGGGKRWVLVAPPNSTGTCLLLARAATLVQESRIGNQTGGRVFLFLHTDDFHRDYEALRSRGIRFESEPREEAYGTVVQHSPDSTTINRRRSQMAVPALLPTVASGETFAGVTYHVDGELVPVLHLELDRVPVYFEHHIILWKDPAVTIALKPLKGAFKRMLSGMAIFMTEARGPGRIAYSRDGVGHVFALHLKAGESLDVREHQFLAATDGIDFTYTRVKGFTNILFGGSGLFIDTFSCPHGEGILWLHGYGNVFEVTLGAGEQIDIEPGGWIYKDRSVNMETTWAKLSTGLLGGASFSLNRFTGPGRVGIQSMYLHVPEAK
jgi:uncharacterized protein (AIM24 family)/predicted enzyme related to lactoylglutathione lyase